MHTFKWILILESDFIAKNSKFYLKKDTFGNIENQPRLYGSSSTNTEDFLKVNKGVFTL